MTDFGLSYVDRELAERVNASMAEVEHQLRESVRERLPVRH